MSKSNTVCVAICRRANRAAFAVVGPDGIYDIQRCDAPSCARGRLMHKAQQLANDYGAETIVAEPGMLTEAPDNLPVATITLRQVKQRLCGHAERSNRPLVEAVVRQHPELQRVIDGAQLSGPSAYLHRWRTVPVLAVALALAFLQT